MSSQTVSRRVLGGVRALGDGEAEAKAMMPPEAAARRRNARKQYLYYFHVFIIYTVADACWLPALNEFYNINI